MNPLTGVFIGMGGAGVLLVIFGLGAQMMESRVEADCRRNHHTYLNEEMFICATREEVVEAPDLPGVRF